MPDNDITNVWKRLQRQLSVYDYVNDESNILRKEMINDIAAHNNGEKGKVHPNVFSQLIKDNSGTDFPEEDLYPGKIWYRTDKKQFYYYTGIIWENLLTPTTVNNNQESGSSGESSESGSDSDINMNVGQFNFNPRNKNLSVYTGDELATIFTSSNMKTNIVNIVANKEYIFNINNSSWRICKILVFDSDSTSKTYGKYVNSEGIIAVGYAEDDKSVTIYNSINSTVKVKIVYISI